MRAIGFFKIQEDQKSILPELEQDFSDYCNANLHQPIKTIVSVVDESVDLNTYYKQMLDYIQSTDSEFLIVVPNATHLGSDLEEVARILTKLDSIGSKVVCYDDEYPDPIQNAFRNLGIKGISATRSANIKKSMRIRASQGQALGRPLFGYRIGATGRLEIIQKEAKVVELLYRLYTKDGLGFRLLAQHLNDLEIPTRRGGKWNVVSIRDILRNPAYIGTYTRLGMRRPNVHEAIVRPEIFRAAQTLMKQRRPIGRVIKYEPFLLSGKLFCAYCGNKMMGVTRRQAWKRKDGKRVKNTYRYYQCQSRNNLSTCEYHTWQAATLEKTVISHMKYLLENSNPVRINLGNNFDMEKSNALEVKNAERRFLETMKRVALGEIGINGIDNCLNDLYKARHPEQSQKTVDIKSVLDNWESLEFKAHRNFISQYINRIDVKDDQVNIAS